MPKTKAPPHQSSKPETVLGSKVAHGHNGVTSQAYCFDEEVPLFLASEVSHLFLLGSSLNVKRFLLYFIVSYPDFYMF